MYWYVNLIKKNVRYLDPYLQFTKNILHENSIAFFSYNLN